MTPARTGAAGSGLAGSGLAGSGAFVSAARRSLLFLLLILLLLPDVADAQSRSRSKKRSTRRKNPKQSVVRAELKCTVQVADGVRYTFTEYPNQRWSVHALTADLSRDGLSLQLGKGLDNVAGLERVGSILHRFDSVTAGKRALAGVNANFWQAGTNHPIGPTVIDGVILNAEKYRNWSAIAISDNGTISIDNYTLHVEVRTRYGVVPVDHVNLRRDSLSRVLYTSYYGAMVPSIDTASIFQASRDTITDDSEAEAVMYSIIDSLRSVSAESGLPKVQFEYLSAPLVNGLVRCIVTQLDTGIVSIPRNGGVFSLGTTPLPFFFSLFVGDTFSLSTTVAPPLPTAIRLMASGTPRLVRDGRAFVAWQEEGLRKIRFVEGNYARTAFGVSQDGRKVVFITVEGGGRRYARKGIPLAALASLLIGHGAWQGLNFDGGGSATMVVDGTTVSPPSGTQYSRKISTALILTGERSVSPGTGDASGNTQ